MNHIQQTQTSNSTQVDKQTAMCKLLEEIPACYQVLLTEGIQLSLREIKSHETLGDYLPEDKAEVILRILNEVAGRVKKENENVGSLKKRANSRQACKHSGFCRFHLARVV